MNYIEKAQKIVLWAEEKKAEDANIIDVTGLTAICDAFVFLSAGNERQLDAIVEFIYIKAKEEGIETPKIEGKKESRWVLLDFGDVVVHVFHKEERKYYDIEKLWADGKFILLPDRE
ncbi:MAG: ribosome silencing factor [Eubacteriaceae bacterium]|nr:ribosome silencing factor [Eubacteriaceae bacterium]